MKQVLLLSALMTMGVASAQQSEVDTMRVHQLEALSVIGTRAAARTPMSYSNIGKSTIKQNNLGTDIPYLLQMQPSTFATSDAGTGIGYTALRVRGVDATGINITLGGVPINDSESQAVFWVNMPDLASSIGGMQIQRGVGTSSNGAASFGASVNMNVEHLSTEPYAEVGLSAGSFGTFRRNVRLGSGRLMGRWAVDARLSKITSDGYVDRGDVDLDSYFVQAGYFGGNTIVKYISFGGKEVTGIAWNGLKLSDGDKYGRTYNSAGDMLEGGKKGVAYYHNTDNYKQTHHHLLLTHQGSPQLALNLTAHYTEGYGYTDEYRTGRNPKEYGLNRIRVPHEWIPGKQQDWKTSLLRRKYLDNDFYGGVATIRWTPMRWQLTFGASANRYEGAHYGEVRWIKGYETMPGGHAVEPNFRYYDGMGYKTDLSQYIKVNHNITRELSAYVDLQYRHVAYRITGGVDNYDSNTKAMQQMDMKQVFNFFNPKLGLFYQIAPAHSLYASMAISHREPNRKNYTDATPDTYPRAEKLTDYELGYGYQSERLSLSANAYYMLYTDQLVMNGKMTDVGGMLLENVPDSYRMGLELQLAVRPLSWLRLDASVGLSQNRIKDYKYFYAVYDTDWEFASLREVSYHNTTIAYSPSVVASGALTAEYAGWTASLRTQYVGKQYLDNTESRDRMLKGFHTMGLALSYKLPIRWVRDWRLDLQINNLLNAKYYSNGYVYDVGIDHEGQTYSDMRYYPQAGINFLLGTTLSI